MTVFVQDTFTDTNGTNLNSHTGETGATWTDGSRTGDLTINGNRVHYGSGTVPWLYASGTPATAEYDVEADFVAVGIPATPGNPGIMGRMATAAETAYLIRYIESGTGWQFLKAVAGGYTVLGTYNTTLTSVKLEIRDAAKKVYLAGVERISSVDNAITAAGKAGITIAAGTSTNGNHVDNFVATDAASGSSVVAEAALSIAGATIAASATRTTPTFTATAAGAIAGATISASASHTAPTFTAAVAAAIAGATISASALGTTPTFTGSAALQNGACVIAVSGTFSPPVFTATVAAGVAGATISASASRTTPTFTATVGIGIAGSSIAASAIFSTSLHSATVSVTIGPMVIAASATFTEGASVFIADESFVGVRYFESFVASRSFESFVNVR
jgi:hypothetical protein